MKSIYIFTDDEDLQISDETYFEKYINENFPGFTVIISEDNKSVLTNEENDAYMVMEYI